MVGVFLPRLLTTCATVRTSFDLNFARRLFCRATRQTAQKNSLQKHISVAGEFEHFFIINLLSRLRSSLRYGFAILHLTVDSGKSMFHCAASEERWKRCNFAWTKSLANKLKIFIVSLLFSVDCGNGSSVGWETLQASRTECALVEQVATRTDWDEKWKYFDVCTWNSNKVYT